MPGAPAAKPVPVSARYLQEEKQANYPEHEVAEGEPDADILTAKTCTVSDSEREAVRAFLGDIYGHLNLEAVLAENYKKNCGEASGGVEVWHRSCLCAVSLALLLKLYWPAHPAHGYSMCS